VCVLVLSECVVMMTKTRLLDLLPTIFTPPKFQQGVLVCPYVIYIRDVCVCIYIVRCMLFVGVNLCS
jgi:hypothetical protein